MPENNDKEKKLFDVKLMQRHWSNTETFRVEAATEEEALTKVQRDLDNNKELQKEEFRLEVNEAKVDPAATVTVSRPIRDEAGQLTGYEEEAKDGDQESDSGNDPDETSKPDAEPMTDEAGHRINRGTEVFENPRTRNSQNLDSSQPGV